MTNTHRGEVEIEAGGKTYVMRLSINAICEVENLLDLSVNEIVAAFADPSKVRMGMLRALVYGGLKESRPDITLGQAGEIIAEAGVARIGEAISEAFKFAFPSPEPGERPSPEAGQGGTGKAS